MSTIRGNGTVGEGKKRPHGVVALKNLRATQTILAAEGGKHIVCVTVVVDLGGEEISV